MQSILVFHLLTFWIRKHYNSVTRTFWARVLSTEIHGCPFEWAVDEMINWIFSDLLTRDEWDHLNIRGSTSRCYYLQYEYHQEITSNDFFVPSAIYFFHPPYASCRKEPDVQIRPNNQRFPSIVMESGWSETIPRIHDDINSWLIGGNGFVKAVIILKWHRVGHTNAVGGHAELYTLDTDGIPCLMQEETIFPAPPLEQAQAQAIRLTRGILFGGTSPPGRKNPNDIFTLRLESLRSAARPSLAFMGLVPF